MSSFNAMFSEYMLRYFNREQPKLRKITTNEGRPCIVYTSEVFKNVKEIDAYLKQQASV